MAGWSQLLTALGQAVERALTGRTEYRLTLSPFPASERVSDRFQAARVLHELQAELRGRFTMTLRDPVLLDLEVPPPWGWKGALAAAGAQLGRYAPRQMGGQRVHRVVVVPGLSRIRFRGVLAHELVHAWQSEQGILGRSRGLREAMARWVEYHVLLEAGGRQEARRLLGLRSYALGRHLQHLLELERREGRAATLRWLRERDQGSPGPDGT